VNNLKNLSAIVFSVPIALAIASPVWACPVSSAYRYVLLNNIPSEIPEGAIVLMVNPTNLEEGDFGKTRHVSKLDVKRVEIGRYDLSAVDLVVAPFSSCTRGNESEVATVLVGYVHRDEKDKPFFFPVQYIGEAHRREGMGDLDRMIIPEDKYVERAFHALKSTSNNE
jgi:hypothetical protein